MNMNQHFPSRDRLLIVQPYIPNYRAALFSTMRESLAESGIQLAVAAAHATGTDAARGDDRTSSNADFLLREIKWSIGSRSMIFRSLAQTMHSFRPGLVVVEQALKNFESFPLLFRRAGARHPSVAMWGQGRSYSTNQSPMVAKLKQKLTQRADWFFAYAPQGAAYVAAQGFPTDKMTVLWNSIDTASLQADLNAISDAELEVFRSELGLKRGHTALFLGGIDERKGMKFLLESARIIGAASPNFKLLIGGSGQMANEVARDAATGSPTHYLGRLEGKEKALALAAADFLMIPEWVGLVAVDSLASGTPLVSTRHASHSPEFEYLVEDQTIILSEHAPSDYAAAVLELIHHPQRLEQMSCHGRKAATEFSIECMADNFVRGILAWRASLNPESG